MKKLILVRHGESEWNKLNLFTGWTNVDLTERGVTEAKEAGKTMKKLGYKPTICFTSYLKRAVKTLNYILDEMDLDYLPVEKSWRLNEKHYGAMQGKNKMEMVEKYGPEQVQIWRRSFNVQAPALKPDDPRCPYFDPRYKEVNAKQLPLTESLKDTVERIVPYFRAHIWAAFDHHEEVLVSAHGNSLRGIVKNLKNLSEEEIVNFNIPTGVPYIFELNKDLSVANDFFLGNPDEIQRKMQEVANQTSLKH